MKIVIGLGNPGDKYKNTRHNAGFLVVDRLISRWQAEGKKKNFNGVTYNALYFDTKIVLAKPQTFMNRSGGCVGPLFGFYKITPEDLIVIHDDIDLKSNTIRIKKGGGNGGHNGLKSIDQNLGTDNKDYFRVRIGVGRPENEHMSSADWVLQSFSKEESETLDALLEQAIDSVELLIQGKASEAMNKFNVKKT